MRRLLSSRAWRKLLIFGADLPGCVATGATADEAKTEIAAAIRFHLDGLKEDGLPVPTPQVRVAMVEA